LINEIKKIIENYINNAKFCMILVGTVVSGGIRISEKIVVPIELIIGNHKKSLKQGDRVRLLRNHGGQQYFILEVIEDDT
jgi:hypothetical protein